MRTQSIRSISVLNGAFAILGALLASQAGATLLEPPLGAEPQSPPADHYIVVFRDSVSKPGRAAERHADNRGARVSHVYRHALKGYAAKIPPDELNRIRQAPSVLAVEPDYRGGIATQELPTGIDRVFAAANEALAINEEDELRVNVDVAVFDTAIDAANHADLDVVGQVNCHGQACKEEESAGGGHGTHVAGTIAAIDNGFGVVGVASGARLWSVKVLSPGGFGNLSDLIAGLDWVTATREDEDPENDIAVTNASLRYWNETESEAFNKALKSSLESGIVHVVAAGNESETVKYIPGNHPDVITVSALADYDGKPGGEASPTCSTAGSDDNLASFSNFGSVVDVAAPGACIYSTLPGNGYGNSSGTSTASPHVAGAAAILAARDKPESKADVEAIRDTIVEAGNFGWEDTSGDGIHEPLLDARNEAEFDPNPLPIWALALTPKIEGEGNRLTDVSCTSSTFCFASGHLTSFGTTWAYGLAWNGSSWANWGGPPENGGTELSGVSCTSSTNCMAVGKKTEGGEVTNFAVRWNGTEWIPQETPNIEGEGNRLTDVSCTSSTFCFASGHLTSFGTTWAYGLAWNGSSWANWGGPPENGALQLNGVSCTSTISCMAVGNQTVSGGRVLTRAVRWEGKGWAYENTENVPGAEENRLLGVSCVSTNCKAVGRYAGGEGTSNLALHSP